MSMTPGQHQDLGYEKGYEDGHQEGYEEGFQKGLQAVLDNIQTQYVEGPNRPDRGSAKGVAMLGVAKDQAEFGRKVLAGEITLPKTGVKK